MAAQSIALNPRFSRATPVDIEWRVPEHVGSRFPEVAEPGLVRPSLAPTHGKQP
jgi:hypothetical protein